MVDIQTGSYAEIYDITGRLKNRVTLLQRITTVDCSDCGEGVFIVKVFTTNGEEITKPQRVTLIKQ